MLSQILPKNNSAMMVVPRVVIRHHFNRMASSFSGKFETPETGKDF
jgi:hypothetical protein